jgi:hypothetical protein
MKNAHKNMGVTEGWEFNAWWRDLVKTLDEFKVPEKEKGECRRPRPHEERYCREAWRYDDRHRLASQPGPWVRQSASTKM